MKAAIYCQVSTDSQQTEESIAYHEAGHAVVSYLLRRRIRHVSTISEGDTLGHVSHGKGINNFMPDCDTSQRTTKECKREVMILFAGNIAECLLSNKDSLSVGSENDNDKAMSYLNYLCGREAELQPYIDDLHDCTKRKLQQYWTAVEALTRELLKLRYISGPLARKIIKETIK